MTAPSRREAPEALMNLPSKEGMGNAGRPLHPQASWQGEARECFTTDTPGSPGVPARNGFNGFLRAPR
jgi:hypothetical protein